MLALQAAAPSGGLLEQIMAARAAAGPSRASFVEQKTIKGLTTPLISRGRLIWQPPDKVEKITDDPVQEVVAVDGNALTITEGNNAARSFDLAAMPDAATLVDAVRGTLDGDLAMLRRNYRISIAGNRRDWTLQLVPINPSVEHVLDQVEIAGSGDTIRQVRIVQAHGDSSLMTIQSSP